MNFSKTPFRPTLSAVTLFSFAIGLISLMPHRMNGQVRRERPPKTESTETLTGDKAVENLKASGGYDSLKDAFQRASASNGGGAGTENILPGGTYEEVGLTASDGAAGDNFGWSVAVFGDTAVVGASADTVGSNIRQGSAYVFVRSGNSWTEQQRIVASDGVAEASFGSSVAVESDTLVVGAYTDAVGSNAYQGSAYVFVRSGTTWTEEQKLTSFDGAAADYFGFSVSISGETVVVGAQTHNSAYGSAYVFTRSGGIWTLEQELTASDGESGDSFGYSVAVSRDTIVVGSINDSVGSNGLQGSAYVFVRSGTTWNEQQQLTSSDGTTGDRFGWTVSIEAETAVIGVPLKTVNGNAEQGAAYIFVRSGTTWTEQQKVVALDGAGGNRFGYSVSVSGETLVIGADLAQVGSSTLQGAAYVLVRAGTSWTQQQKLTDSPGANFLYFGHSVAINGDTVVVGVPLAEVGSNTNQGSVKIFQTKMAVSKKASSDGGSANQFGFAVALSGNTAVVGSFGNSAAYVFVRSGSAWTQQAKLEPSDNPPSSAFGISVAFYGDTAVIGANFDSSSRGSAYVFVRSSGIWTQQQKLTAPDGVSGDEFGFSVSISGDTAVIGARSDEVGGNIAQGSAYVFVRTSGTWAQQQKLTASDGDAVDCFGASVVVSGDTAIVGAYLDDVGSNTNQGSAYVFTRTGTLWSEQQQVTASDGAAFDLFGRSVSISTDTLAVGADGSGNGAGSAYLFVRSGTVWNEQQKVTAYDRETGHQFGFSVSVSGDLAVVGAFREGPGTTLDIGAAYIFTRSGTVWSQQRKLMSNDRTVTSMFGRSVAADGSTMVVGADGDVVNSNPAQGSAYFYYWGPFGPTAAGSRLSGRVLAADGRGLRNAMVVVTDSDGIERVTQTGTFGNFTFNDLPSGDSFVLSVRSRLYRFTPQMIYLAADLDGVRLQPAAGRR